MEQSEIKALFEGPDPKINVMDDKEIVSYEELVGLKVEDLIGRGYSINVLGIAATLSKPECGLDIDPKFSLYFNGAGMGINEKTSALKILENAYSLLDNCVNSEGWII
jgi:hypothetical protein